MFGRIKLDKFVTGSSSSMFILHHFRKDVAGGCCDVLKMHVRVCVPRSEPFFLLSHHPKRYSRLAGTVTSAPMTEMNRAHALSKLLRWGGGALV